MPPLLLPPANEAITPGLVLRAFAAGCGAMTGVEAVSNGMTAFHDPRVARARGTLSVIVINLALLLFGVAHLVPAHGIGAVDQAKPGYRTVLS